MANLKLRCYLAIGWGLLVVFAIIGTLTGRIDAAAIVGIITAVMWVMMRIIQDAVDAVIALRELNKKDTSSET